MKQNNYKFTLYFSSPSCIIIIVVSIVKHILDSRATWLFTYMAPVCGHTVREPLSVRYNWSSRPLPTQINIYMSVGICGMLIAVSYIERAAAQTNNEDALCQRWEF